MQRSRTVPADEGQGVDPESLFSAVCEGDVERLAALLEISPNLLTAPIFSLSLGGSLRVRDGATLLHVASWSGNADAIMWLLRSGSDPDCLDGLGRKAIEVASSQKVRDVLGAASRQRTIATRLDQLDVDVENGLTRLGDAVMLRNSLSAQGGRVAADERSAVGKVASLQKTVKQLKQRIASLEEEMDDLHKALEKSRVRSKDIIKLNAKVDTLTAELDELKKRPVPQKWCGTCAVL